MTKTLNKNFIIVFQPKEPAKHGNRRRFAIGAGKLAEYIGQQNADNLINKALESSEDVYTRNLRITGRISFYCR